MNERMQLNVCFRCYDEYMKLSDVTITTQHDSVDQKKKYKQQQELHNNLSNFARTFDET